MASLSSSGSDKRYHFVEEPPSKYICPVCVAVAAKPHQVACCGGVICLSCLENLKQGTSSFTCPTCQEENMTEHFADKRTTKEISYFKVYCVNESSDGCDWQGELRAMDDHLMSCAHRIVTCTGGCGEELKWSKLEDHLESQCPLRTCVCPHCNVMDTHIQISQFHLENCPDMTVQCSNQECSEVLKKRELEEHLSQHCLFQVIECRNHCGKNIRRDSLADHFDKDCLKRRHSCPDCGMEGSYDFIMSQRHTVKCPDRIVSCPNAECQEKLKQGEVEVHRTFCPKERVRCGYGNLGCLQMLPRDQLLQHNKEDAHKHLHRAMLKIKANHEEYQAEMAKMASKVRTLTEQISILEAKVGGPKTLIKFNNIEVRKQKGVTWFSRGFYTSSSSGYKMRLKIYLNEDIPSVYTHLSCYIIIMPGEYDDILEWPFRGEVTVELLNQLEDKNHHKRVIAFDDSTHLKYRQRKLTQSMDGWGFQTFISHADLFHNCSKKSQYLLDDSLYFRISTNVKSKIKPWLGGYMQDN